MPGPEKTGPLAGVRVLELARILAGPWAGQILADLGAEVTKVERKGTGDDTRGWGPPFVEGKDGKHLGAAYFHAANRGKRSIELDFESEDGKRIVRKLAERSDILIENFKVGGLKKFGLDYESLAKVNPRLIYCSVTGFGQTGPDAPRAGYDLMAQGIGGFMDLTGMADGEPTRAGVPVSDIFTGVYAVVGVLAALNQRERTGKGCHVDAALVDSTVGVLANQALNFLVSGDLPKRIGNTHPEHRALSGVRGRPTAISSSPPATTGSISNSAACSARRNSAEDRGVSRQQGSAGQAPRTHRQARAAGEEDEARRPSCETRSRHRAGRPDQQSRAGVQRSAGGSPRHETRTAER